MPTGVEGPELLVDTSVAVPLLVTDHQHHAEVFNSLADQRLGMSGHAAFETYSVLTRLPVPARRTPSAVGRLLASNFPHTRFLSAGRSASLLVALAAEGLAGGSVFDALVGAAAAEHDLPLATRDRRALEVYRVLKVDAQLL